MSAAPMADNHTQLNVEQRLSYLGSLALKTNDIAFVGIGVPGLAAMLAKRTHAPDLCMIFESGAIDANPATLPLSTGSPSVANGARMIGSMLDVFAMLQTNRIDVGLLSGAQVDRHGNLNSTVLGPYDRPKVRLPGSGGALDIALLAKRLIILMPHEPKRFVERVNFVTSPGFLNGGGERKRLGLPGQGPVALITDRAVFGFQDEEVTLTAVHAGFDIEQAVEGIPWTVKRAAQIDTIPELSATAKAAYMSMRSDLQ
jgi:glutaconate CoA-transferase subunit B